MTDSAEAANVVSSGVLDNTGRRDYSVSGLDANEDYDIALFPAENVSVDENGVVTFNSSATVTDNSGVSIEQVNGSQQTLAGSGNETEQVNNVSPTSEGVITFIIDSTVQDQVIPVIWLDAEETGDNQFDRESGTGFQAPTEDFGIGGQKNWVPAEATTATHANQTVTTVNENLDYFVAGAGTFYYDSNDLYRVQGGANLSMAEFEALLTTSDVIDVTYDRDEADSSVFEVDTDVVPAPSSITTTVSDADGDGTSDDVVVTWTASSQDDAVYDLFRSTDAACDANDTVLLNDSDALTYTDNSVAATSTTVYYCVRAVGGETGQNGSFATSSATVVPPA